MPLVRYECWKTIFRWKGTIYTSCRCKLIDRMCGNGLSWSMVFIRSSTLPLEVSGTIIAPTRCPLLHQTMNVLWHLKSMVEHVGHYIQSSMECWGNVKNKCSVTTLKDIGRCLNKRSCEKTVLPNCARNLTRSLRGHP